MTPIVLHHGMFGFDELRIGRFRLPYFAGIDRAIARDGHPLIISRVHPTGGISTRARQLKNGILRQLRAQRLDDRRVVIIAHSMGGLDARFMISRLGMAERVAALVTVCTPHRGSPYADWCIRNIGRRLGALRVLNLLRLDVQAASDLTVRSCQLFNHDVKDAPQVRYFSISAAVPWQRVPAFLLHSHHLISEKEGANDGLVSVASAKWGEHLGTWPMDHFQTINHRLIVRLLDPSADAGPRYRDILKRLRSDKLC